MPSKRLELTVSEELWGRMELARGDVSRARWVKTALEAFLSPDAIPAPAPQRPNPMPASPPRGFAVPETREGDMPRTESRHEVRRPQFVRATSLVTPEIKSEWAAIMEARQARLNKKRDGAA